MEAPVFISVIIPTFNRAHLLARAIQSVLDQTYQHWELIIVDDGSTDDTSDVVAGFAEERIRYINKENTGAAHSRNVGAELASGSLLTFLDSDDEVIKDWLLTFVNMYEEERYDLASCEVSYFDGVKKWKRGPGKLNGLYHGFSVRFNAGAYLVSADLFSKVGGFDASFSSGHHTELGVRLSQELFQSGGTVSVIPKVLIHVYRNNGLRIRTDHKAVLEGSLQFLEKHQALLAKVPNYKSTCLASAAYRAFLLGEQGQAIQLQLECLYSNPLKWKNYLRLFRYFVPIIPERKAIREL